MITTGDGEDAAIGHLDMLAKTFRQMLVITEPNVRDTRALWQVLWQGFRVPPFAAEDVIQPGSPVQVSPRIDARHPVDRKGRPEPPFKPPQASAWCSRTWYLISLPEPKPVEVGWYQEELPV